MTTEPEQPSNRTRPESAGPLLREARMRRGLAIAEVAADTRINPAYLEAMEAERWELLPAPVYARGFFRSYARYLRLDEAAIERLVPSHLPRPRELEPAPGLRRRAAEPALALPSFEWLRGLGNRSSEMRRPPSRPTQADRATFNAPRATPRTTTTTTTRAARGSAGGAAGASVLGALRGQWRGLAAAVTSAGGDPQRAGLGALVAVALLLAAGGYYWYAGREESPAVVASPTAVRSQAAGPEPTTTAGTAGTSGTANAASAATSAPKSGEMPDLVGRTRREAEDEMGRLGLAFVVIEVATPASPPGTVYNQSPEPGKSIKRGDSVTLLVARAP
ncbi:MAG: helix-turn-helix domain-containing protein [Dehalococcoidia bacterium]|nr:helix-turn-helix domain-containing protein [Dehalococcoidia bacterium]